MYIEKYWGEYIGGTDDSLNLIAFLEDRNKECISLQEIFTGVGLDQQGSDFRQTTVPLEFTDSNGVEIDFHFAIDLLTDLSALLLECKVNGGVNLQDLEPYNAPDRTILITATAEEHALLCAVLADFAENPLAYDLHELVPNEDMQEMAAVCENIRKELYNS